MGEVALGVESLGDGLMVGELLAVVIGERVDKVGMRLQYCEQGVRDGLCGLVGSLGNDAVACPALRKREQDRAAGLADHGVGLPVSGAGAFLDDLRPLVDRNPTPDLAPAVITPVAFPAPLLATQVGMEITATALVRIDILVDPFVADLLARLLRQPTADLLQSSVDDSKCYGINHFLL